MRDSDHGSGSMVRALRAGPFHVSRMVHTPGLRLPVHEHQNACFHYVLHGRYTESTSRRRTEVLSGEVLWKPPATPQWNDFSSESRSLRIDFSPVALDGSSAVLPPQELKLRDRAIEGTCLQVLHELEVDDDASRVSVEGLCLHLMALLARTIGPARRSPPPTMVTRCEEYLRDHCREPVRFSAVAAELGVGRTHLATLFRRHRGCTLGTYVRRLRVTWALEQIRCTSRPLAEIAIAAGFSDQSHCNRVFRALTAATPGEWRDRRVR